MTREVPVLIVGAGPAGLTTAATLAHHGIEFLLVERRAELSSLPRATSVSVRSMELMRSFGLERQILAGDADVDWLQWRCRTLAQVDDGEGLPTGFPLPAQAAVVSPCAPACVPQDHLEPVLLDHIRSLGVGEVRLGTEVVSIESSRDGVRAHLSDSSAVHAHYLVAADGAHSMVRQALGIEMHGPERLLDAVTALFRAPLWELVGDKRYGIYAISHPDADGVFLPAGPSDRWLYGVPFEPDALALTEGDLRRRIQIGAGVPGLDPRIERVGSFTFAAKLAERYREGNAFLVGDAAHRATPRGGTGMNTGIHDGYDLGWKLAWVLRGWGDPELLDTYEQERRPVAEHNVEMSAEVHSSSGDPGRALQADIGGRMTHVWTARDGAMVSTLDLLGQSLTLFTGPDPAPWMAAARAVRGRLPVTVEPLDDLAARAVGVRAGGALLARPDGAPAGWFAPGAAGVLALGAAIRDPVPAAGASLAA